MHSEKNTSVVKIIHQTETALEEYKHNDKVIQYFDEQIESIKTEQQFLDDMNKS
jgi:hypothetical protein